MVVCSIPRKRGLRIYEGDDGLEVKASAVAAFNGGVEQEPGQHRYMSWRRCLASVVAVSCPSCMVPAAYAQDVDDVNGSSNP